MEHEIKSVIINYVKCMCVTLHLQPGGTYYIVKYY
jgi:hypothetical protein